MDLNMTRWAIFKLTTQSNNSKLQTIVIWMSVSHLQLPRWTGSRRRPPSKNGHIQMPWPAEWHLHCELNIQSDWGWIACFSQLNEGLRSGIGDICPKRPKRKIKMDGRGHFYNRGRQARQPRCEQHEQNTEHFKGIPKFLPLSGVDVGHMSAVVGHYDISGFLFLFIFFINPLKSFSAVFILGVAIDLFSPIWSLQCLFS